MDVRQYICAHKSFTPPDENSCFPLQVGSALRPDLGYLRDDAGEQISEKNPTFCELTGVYWIWKNVSCDAVGICHYRRYFVEDGDVLSQKRVEELLSDHDVILPRSGLTDYDSVKDHYEHEHYLKDLMHTRAILEARYPAYLPAFDLSMDSNLFSLGNMMICRKDLFDQYCAWLFDILFTLEKETDLSGYDAFQARLYGYISERLLRVYVLNHALRVREVEVCLMDPENKKEELRKNQLIREMTAKIVSDVVTLYQRGAMQDLVQEWPKMPDFQGKIPVFAYRWQGFEDAPGIIQSCRESLKKNLPDNTVLLEITEKTLGQYLILPEHIRPLLAKGSIPEQHLAELIRTMLLYRYGGLWADSTLFLTRSLPPAFFLQEFYALYYEKEPPVLVSDLLLCQKGNPLMGTLLNMLCYYWFQMDRLIDADLLRELTALCYRELPGIRAFLEGVPAAGKPETDVKSVLKRRYRKEQVDALCAEVPFIRLDETEGVKELIVTGEETGYGHLLHTIGKQVEV